MSLPFRHGLPFVPTDTSKAAAKSFDDAVVRSDRQVVLGLIEKHGSMTDDELEVCSNMSHQTVSARRNGLVRDGLVCDSGHRRETRSGRKAIVWVLGKGTATEGASNERTLRPTDEEIAEADAEIGQLLGAADLREGDALKRVRAWLRSIS